MRSKGDLTPITRLERLYTAVVADCLDRVGIRSNVMAANIRPLYPETKIAGYAITVKTTDIDRLPENPDDYYKGELQAVDSLQDGDVMVVSTTEGSYWGELLATAAKYRGARGVIIDGYCRDTLKLIEMRFPTFSRGILCSDSLGRMDVTGVNVSIRCGDVTVEPGDLILADYDGVVCIPSIAAEEVLARAEEKVSGENTVREELARGRPVLEAFRAHGVI